MRSRYWLIAFAIIIGISSGVVGLDQPCSVCTDQAAEEFRSGCPYTRLIECWCETQPDWVCCLYEHCELLYFGGPCTKCDYYEDCFFYYPCEGLYPTKAAYFGGPGGAP